MNGSGDSKALVAVVSSNFLVVDPQGLDLFSIE